MIEPTDSLFSFRAIVARVAAFTLFGLLAGFALFAIEAIDRTVVLSHSIHGPGSAVALAALMGVTVLACGIFGFLLGVLVIPLEVPRQAIAAVGRRLAPKLGPLAVDAMSAIVAAIIVAVLLKMLSGAFPHVLEHPIERLVNKFDDRMLRIPFVKANWMHLYTLALFGASAAIIWAHAWIFRPHGRRSRLIAAAVTIAGAAALAGCYWFDSRAFFARYEYTIHWPLVTGYVLMTVLLVGFLLRATTSMRWAAGGTRFALGFGAALMLFGCACTVYAAAAMDVNQDVKALFWNRSVIARRPYEIARRLIDRDGDGFSPVFGGGDPNDADASVHPLAPEVPANGVDENGIGGDLPAEAAAAAPRRAQPGEFLPVSDAPRWDPKYIPADAVDVASPEAAQPRNGATASDRPNVILLTIDCLRADHMSLYGYHRPTTPNIDRHAANGLVFEYAVSTGTNTGHSFASLLRSSYMEAIFDRNVPTLTQLSKQAGYQTAFINARQLGDWLTPRRWHRYRPTMIGDFDVLHLEREREWTAEELTDHAIRYLDALPAGQPHFTWIHYMDVHMPREGHPSYGFGDRDVDVYDAEAKYTDEHVGRLLDHLKATGTLDRTILFITADHGESFLAHGTRDHSNKPYADQNHVPLIVLAPGAAPRRVATPVAHIDIAPTAAAFAGLPVPPVYRGIDLLAASRLAEFPRRVLVGETPRNGIETNFFAWAWIDWPYKYVYDVRYGAHELYHLERDPQEQINLIELEPERATAMREALGRWLDLETAAPLQARAASEAP